MVNTLSRDLNFLDFAKIIATFLVVIGHILRMYTGNGLFLPLEGNFYFSVICKYIYTFHMPLFFFISGGVFYIVKHNKNRYNDMVGFISNKTKRLLVPYIFISILLLIVMWHIGEIHIPICIYYIKNYVFAYGCRHLWFLIALFVISFYFNIFDSYICSNTYCCVVFILGFLVADYTTYFLQIASVLKFSIYYYFGYQVIKNFIKLQFLFSIKTSICLFLISLALFFLGMKYEGLILEKIFELILGLLGTIMVIGIALYIEKNMDSKGYLQQVNSYMYSIYLFHPLIIYLLFYYCRNTYINSYLMIICGFLISIFFSILLSKLVRALGLRAFLGEK